MAMMPSKIAETRSLRTTASIDAAPPAVTFDRTDSVPLPREIIWLPSFDSDKGFRALSRNQHHSHRIFTEFIRPACAHRSSALLHNM
jgi:hypothetical protein